MSSRLSVLGLCLGLTACGPANPSPPAGTASSTGTGTSTTGASTTAPRSPATDIPLSAGTGRPSQYLLRYQGVLQGSTVVDTSGARNHGLITAAGTTAPATASEPGTDPEARDFFRFPTTRCDLANGCAQVMIEPRTVVGPGDGGTAPFSFGARVRLPAAAGPDGQNVIERGRAVAGHAQWKLQVDHGQATCRWSDGATALLLPTDLGRRFDLDPGRWYDLVCTRRPGGVFALLITDPVTGDRLAAFGTAAPRLGAITPTGPISIGAKRIGGPDSRTDQFRGDLDDVFVGTG